jgi:hypothetical protein
MAKIQLAQVPEPVVGAEPPYAAMLDTSRVFPQVDGSMDSVRQEIDDAFADMKEFLQQEPDEIMKICAGHSARLSELRVRISRIEDFHRQWKNVRIREIEVALEEIQNQFSAASRLLSARDLDYRIERGAP